MSTRKPIKGHGICPLVIFHDAYIFSVAREGYGRIVACRAKDSSEVIGKSIYKHLGMPHSEIEFFQSELNAYGKTSIAAMGQDKAVLFFKYFAYDTSLCLAVALDLPTESVSVIMRGFFFESFAVSEGLKAAASAERRFSAREEKEIYDYLTSVIGQIETLSCLKLQRNAEHVGTLRTCMISVAEFVGVKIECEAVAADGEELYFERPEIFDGRFCAACFLTLAMIARAHSRDRRLSCEIVGGFDYLRLKFQFDAFDDGWEGGAELLLRIAHEKHGMDFGYEFHEGLVTVNFSPFYADVGFVGVKQDDGSVGIEELGELC